MRNFDIQGMSCASCQAKVEKAVKKVEGVTSCSVSLLTNSMGVEGSASDEDIIKAVENAGYKASPQKKAKTKDKGKEDDGLSNKKEIKTLIIRLSSSAILMLILMYFSMGVMMWSWPCPSIFAKSHTALGLLEMILSAAIMIINGRFFTSGFKSLIHLSPNMDALVAIGSSSAFIYSTYSLFMMALAESSGDHMGAMALMDSLYFESAAMILTLITLGKLLEAISKGKTTDAIKSLIKMAPKTATLIRDGKEVKVDIDDVNVGDIFVVRPGESIPVDGVVIEGESAVNEAALTGESVPQDKEINSAVYSATINTSGYLKCRATKVKEETTLSRIIQLMSDASRTKAPISKIADKVSSIFVPVVIGISIITLVSWLIATGNFSSSLLKAISVLVVSCPCALGLATPVAIMVSSGVAAKNGILFKTAEAMETTGKCSYAILDKTGTITKGESTVKGIYPYDGISENDLVELAVSLESMSEHPLSKAIVKKAEELGIKPLKAESFRISAGSGLEAKINGTFVYGGNLKFISSKNNEILKMESMGNELSLKGETPLYFASSDRVFGIISVRDTIKDDSKKAVDELKGEGIEVVMLTGDNEKSARAIAKEVSIDNVEAGVLPDGKERVVSSYTKRGKTIMVGDGINDGPALIRSDVGMAIGNASEVAIDSADVVLIRNSLLDVPKAVRISRKTIRNIHENLFWAFGYNIVGIPLAAGVFSPLGWELNPMFAALCMSISSFLVVTNALRLNLMNTSSTKHDRRKRAPKENIEMKKEIRIDGMMCSHCEMTVKNALESIDGIKSASVSHKKGSATVKLEKDVSDDEIRRAIEAKDYKVISIS